MPWIHCRFPCFLWWITDFIPSKKEWIAEVEVLIAIAAAAVFVVVVVVVVVGTRLSQGGRASVEWDELRSRPPRTYNSGGVAQVYSNMPGAHTP
jgi:hypothetical protein